jgi:transposase
MAELMVSELLGDAMIISSLSARPPGTLKPIVRSGAQSPVASMDSTCAFGRPRQPLERLGVSVAERYPRGRLVLRRARRHTTAVDLTLTPGERPLVRARPASKRTGEPRLSGGGGPATVSGGMYGDGTVDEAWVGPTLLGFGNEGWEVSPLCH